MNEFTNKPKFGLSRKSPRHISTDRTNKADQANKVDWSNNAEQPNESQHSNEPQYFDEPPRPNESQCFNEPQHLNEPQHRKSPNAPNNPNVSTSFSASKSPQQSNNFKQPAKSKQTISADQPNRHDRRSKSQRSNKSEQSKLLVRRLTFKLFRDIAIYTVAAIVFALILNATLVPRIANWVADNTSSSRYISFDSTSLIDALNILDAEVYYVANNPMELLDISNKGIIDEILAASSDSLSKNYSDYGVALGVSADSMLNTEGSSTTLSYDTSAYTDLAESKSTDNGASANSDVSYSVIASADDPATSNLSASDASESVEGDISAYGEQRETDSKSLENEYSSEYNAILKEAADGNSIVKAWGLTPLSTAQAAASVTDEKTSLLLCQIGNDSPPYWYEPRALQELATNELINNGSFGKNVQVTNYDENTVAIRELSTYASIKELKIPVAIAFYLFGLLIVILLGYGRALKYYDDLVSGVASLVGNKEKPIQLPPILASTQSELNEIRLASLADERAAQAAERRKDELVAYLAHDVKTPLTSVIGYLNLLDEAPDMPEESRRKYIQTAFQKSERLEELIDEFFEITRYNLQAIPIERTYIDARLFCEQVVEEFYPEASSRALKLKVNVATDGSIFVDPDKLARALGNVVRNAVAYADANTEVLVSMGKEQEYASQWVIKVENRGREISKAHLESIFDKFYREEKSRTSTSGRAGLGLAIAKEIVLAHGGEISAESENGRTVFTIVLPA